MGQSLRKAVVPTTELISCPRISAHFNLSWRNSNCHQTGSMDALLSIPVLGYFLMPSLTTYSTSLNLLFFYMTWSTLVLTQPPLRVEIVGTLGIRFLFFLVPSTLFLIFDSILPSLAIGMKKQGSAALPTRAGGAQVSRRGATRPRWYKVIGLSVFNIFLGLVIQAGVELLFTQVFHIRSALRVTTTLPMPWSICKDLMRALVLREVFQHVPYFTMPKVTHTMLGPSILYPPLYPTPQQPKLHQQTPQ